MILKHRDRELLRFEWTESDNVRILSLEEEGRKFLPIEFGDAASDKGREDLLEDRLLLWLNRRTAPMGRHFIRDLMASLGLNMRDPDFHRKALSFSRGLSLNDVYWVVSDDFGGSWEEFNLYSNEFSKSMAEIAFSGHGSRSPGEVTTSPEMTTNGMLPKCWRRVKDRVLLYKGGSDASLVADVTRGLEPYSEFYASQIATCLGFSHVDYNLAMYKGRLCSTCPLFTSEKIGYLPAARLPNRSTAVADPLFAETFLFDALVFNTDRHLGNFGYLVDNDTNEIVGAAPIFDNGYGLFSLAEVPLTAAKNDFAPLVSFLHGKHPALFDRWLGFSDSLKDSLLTAVDKLRGFRFRRHQHYNLPSERLGLIQGFLQKRVEDILRYGENADKYIRITEKPVGVNSRVERSDVGVNVDLDALSLQILWNMKADPLVTAKILAEVLGVEQRTIERRIRALREKNVLKRIGEDKSGHWQVLL